MRASPTGTCGIPNRAYHDVVATKCPDCGRAFGMSIKRAETITGRVVCTDCRDDTLAAAAGVITTPATPVAGAVASQGWFRRLRARRTPRS
jgi:hypothetical protein